MSISVENDEVETLIHQAAKAMDKSLTDAMREALVEWLHNHEVRLRTEEEARQKRIDDILQRMRAWPVYDDRNHGDMLYDGGLPK